MSETDAPILSTSWSSLIELSEKTGYKYQKILDYHHAIPDKHAICVHKENVHGMMLQRDGFEIAIDEYWLREGQKELNERIYDKTKWLIPVIALIITVGSLYYSISSVIDTQNKVSQQQKQVIEMQHRIDGISDTLGIHD
jgi:hypothetical protein